MKTKTGKRCAFLTVAAFALAVSACGGTKQSEADAEKEAFADLRAEITSLVPEVDRRDQALAMVDDLEVLLNKLDRDVQDRAEQFRLLNANYDATRADLEAGVAAVGRQMQSNFGQLSAQYRKLSQELTTEEWESLDKAKSKAMETAVAGLLDRNSGESQ